MRADLHVHSRHSGLLGVPLLGAVARECFSEPAEVYEAARRRGMDLVTLTDHDAIDGALELASAHAVAFVSEEVTLTLPGARQIHVGVFGLDARQHQRIERLRLDAEAFFAFLAEESLPAAFNHPFSALTGPRETRDLLLGLRNLPLLETRNGLLGQTVNECARLAAKITRLKSIGGSDAHTLRSVARAYTEVPGARDSAGFLDGLRQGYTVPRGETGGYARLTADVCVLFGSGTREAARLAGGSPWGMARLALALLSLPLLPLVPLVTAGIFVNEELFARRHARALLGEPASTRLRPPSQGALRPTLAGAPR
jgi:predicted metal-dependent phosphoesterase TrpH